MGVDGPHKTAEYLQNTLKARLPLVVAGSQSTLYVKTPNQIIKCGVGAAVKSPVI